MKAASQFFLEGEEVIRKSTGLPVRGTPNATGHLVVGYATGKSGGRTVLLHRLKFYLLHGWLPPLVEHKDRHPDHNASRNLRTATKSQNAHNTTKTWGSLPQGVKRCRDKYQARCQLRGQGHHLGTFATIAEAEQAVQEFKRKHLGTFYPHT